MNSNESNMSFNSYSSKSSKSDTEPVMPGFTKVQELVYKLKVGDAMTQNIITASSEMLMSQLGEIFRSKCISCAPVLEADRLVGIVNIGDFIEWSAEDKKDCTVKNRMNTEFNLLYADEPLTHAVDQLEQSGFGLLPVVDRQNERLVGIVTRSNIIEGLLRKLEIDYHEEEIHRYRASHLFEDIIADKVTLTFQSSVKGKDFNQAGEASSRLKKTLERLGLHPHIVRRAAIASYEAEMNLVIYTEGGEITAQVQPAEIHINVKDWGPGIADIKMAMKPGYSTAPQFVRELGFGAGMGLVNIKKCADKMKLTSTVGKGTDLKIRIDIKDVK